MACCKACCGCADCEEGDQGKCCCGGSTGECCTESEYCCSGVCQAGPCGTPCETDEDCPCVGPEDPYLCPDEDDCCGPLGLVAAGTYGGDAVCCPEGWTFDESSLACLPPDGQSDCYCCDGVCQGDPCPP